MTSWTAQYAWIKYLHDGKNGRNFPEVADKFDIYRDTMRIGEFVVEGKDHSSVFGRATYRPDENSEITVKRCYLSPNYLGQMLLMHSDGQYVVFPNPKAAKYTYRQMNPVLEDRGLSYELIPVCPTDDNSESASTTTALDKSEKKSEQYFVPDFPVHGGPVVESFAMQAVLKQFFPKAMYSEFLDTSEGKSWFLCYGTMDLKFALERYQRDYPKTTIVAFRLCLCFESLSKTNCRSLWQLTILERDICL